MTDKTEIDTSEYDSPSALELSFGSKHSNDIISNESIVSPCYRTKNPLFDAPEIIDDKDSLNAQEKLSSDDDGNNNINIVPNERPKIFDVINPSTRAKSLLPQKVNCLVQPVADDENVPEYRKFVLPPTPEPDDSKLEAEMQQKYPLEKLLQKIRTS